MEKITAQHRTDENGNPAGGVTFGPGFSISWQNGPLTACGDRKLQNGAFVEQVIEAARDRVQYYQTTKFNCGENEMVLEHLEKALEWIRVRIERRKKEGVEGTHKT